MDILLWRHAEAEEGYPDSERMLTPKGQNQAKGMAKWIKGHAPASLHIIVSPAVRCQSTAKALGETFHTDNRLSIDGSVKTLIEAIKDQKDIKQTILIVGHQPTLGDAAAYLLGIPQGFLIKKGALWWLCSKGENKPFYLKAVLSPDLV